MIKVLVADDHAVVRKGLRQIVADTNDIVVAGEAIDGKSTLREVSENEYDMVLLDIALPDMSGLEVLKQLANRKPQLRVLILSMYPEEQYAIRALKAGAWGYVTKQSAPDELITAIRNVSQGRRYVSSSLAENLALWVGSGTGTPLHQQLSDREYQVMCMIAAGKTANQISQELLLSVKTVYSYRSRVLEKMGMKHNAEPTRYAIQHGLIS